MSSFPERLKKARTFLGWSADVAAGAAGAARATVYNWEKGQGTPGDDYLRALVEAGISAAWLVLGPPHEMEAMGPDEAQQRLRLVRVALEADDVAALVELLERLDPGD